MGRTDEAMQAADVAADNERIEQPHQSRLGQMGARRQDLERCDGLALVERLQHCKGAQDRLNGIVGSHDPIP